MTLINLLPQDTRIAELISGFALVLFSVCIFITKGNVPSDMLNFNRVEYWFLITFIIGFLQVASIVLCSQMEHLRFILSWLTGSFWIWTSTDSLSTHLTPSTLGALVLGLMNLYAFIVNLLLVKQSWK